MSLEKLEQYITTADVAELNVLLTQNPELAIAETSHKVSPLMLSCYYKKPEVTALLLKFVSEINIFKPPPRRWLPDIL